MGDTHEKNQVEAFKILMGSQEAQDDKSPYLYGKDYGDLFALLFQQLKTKLVNMDLIQTIKYNIVYLFKVKVLLSQLHKLEVSGSIISFILDFHPFLKQPA